MRCLRDAADTPRSGDPRRRLVETRSEYPECFLASTKCPTSECYFMNGPQKCLTGRLVTGSCLHLLQDLTCHNVMRTLISLAFNVRSFRSTPKAHQNSLSTTISYSRYTVNDVFHASCSLTDTVHLSPALWRCTGSLLCTTHSNSKTASRRSPRMVLYLASLFDSVGVW